MISYKFYAYNDNVIEKVLADFQKENTVFIYPTGKSKKESLKLFQKEWSFSNTVFLTMEEFKERLFSTDGLPILKEDKRTIALYNSMSNSNKKSLNIDNYFSSIGFANNFFSFWEEFNEETVPINKSLEELLPNTEILEWQSELFKLMRLILEDYRTYLDENNWTDILFLYQFERLKEGQLNLDTIFGKRNDDNQDNSLTRRFVFVNQHYYTKLENRILNLLSEQDAGSNEVFACYQLPEKYVNQTNNTVRDDIDFQEDNEEILTKKIVLNINSNNFATLNSLIRELNEADTITKLNIIDRNFLNSTYSRFLNPKAFIGRERELLANSSIYTFFLQVETILSNLLVISDKDNLEYIIPLHILMKLVRDRQFFNYFSEQEDSHTALLNYLQQVRKKEDYYISLSDNEFPTKLLDFVKNLISINSISAFIDRVGKREAIDVEKLLTETERASNLLELFYQSLANLSALDEMGIIEEHTFSNLRDNPVQWILKLFIMNLKAKTFNYQYNAFPKRYNVSSLLDSRNISYDNVAILNLIEGILPSRRITPFLLTENQRKDLGLKNYEDIRNREKYYFFRLIFNSENVWLFTEENFESDIEISSFVEELLLVFEGSEMPEIIVKHHNKEAASRFVGSDQFSDINVPDYKEIYHKIVTPEKGYKTNTDAPKLKDFYILPFNRETDLKNGSLTIRASGFITMLDSLFSFYLREVANIDEEMKDTPLSNLLIGTIAHHLFQKIWEELNSSQERGLTAPRLSAITNKVCEEELASDAFSYKIPKTYDTLFFRRVVLNFIKDSIAEFFELNKEILEGQDIRIAPEGDTNTLLLQFAEPLFNVTLKGKTDLIIETEENHRHIFDYKTGKIDNNELVNQLIIYELIRSYGDKNLDSPKETETLDNWDSIKEELEKNSSSYLYSLIEGKQKAIDTFFSRKIKPQLLDSFLESLQEMLSNIADNGFIYGKRSKNNIHSEIIRRDLLRKYEPDKNEQSSTDAESNSRQ